MSKKFKHTGDTGLSRLYDNQIKYKDDEYFHLLGNIDELNSHIGYSIFLIKNKDELQNIIEQLQLIQNNLIYFSGIIASPLKDKDNKDKEEKNIEKCLEIEEYITILDDKLPILTKFLLPTDKSSYFHILRCITRRCERYLVSITQKSDRNLLKNILIYFNRLSDYFFCVSRYVSIVYKIDDIVYNNNM